MFLSWHIYYRIPSTKWIRLLPNETKNYKFYTLQRKFPFQYTSIEYLPENSCAPLWREQIEPKNELILMWSLSTKSASITATFLLLVEKENHTSLFKFTVWKESLYSLIFIRNHETTNISCQSFIKQYTFNKNLFLRWLNNIKVMHLQCVVIRLDRTHHSQSVFSTTDETITIISLGEKQSSVEVQQKEHHNSYNMLHDYV